MEELNKEKKIAIAVAAVAIALGALYWLTRPDKTDKPDANLTELISPTLKHVKTTIPRKEVPAMPVKLSAEPNLKYAKTKEVLDMTV
jgi:hypothetical protein